MRISLCFPIGKGLPFWYIGKRQTTHLSQNERPRTVRRKKADLHARVNDNLKMEFTGEGLTSYAGLELLMRYLRNIDWNRQLRRHLGTVGFGGDFGVVSLCRVLLGLLLVGGRRLRHLDFLKGDPALAAANPSMQALAARRERRRRLRFNAHRQEMETYSQHCHLSKTRHASHPQELPIGPVRFR